MTDYGNAFNRPPIRSSVLPGSWSYLRRDSPFLSNAVGFTLDYISNELKHQLPPNIKTKVFISGAQIVAGINIYLEIRIETVQTLDVQILIYNPTWAKDGLNRKPVVKNIHLSKQKLFNE